MMKVHHHSYNLPGITDLAVLKAQAEKRRDKEGETTIVHDHAYSTKTGCTVECRVYEPGFITRSVAEVRCQVDG